LLRSSGGDRRGGIPGAVWTERGDLRIVVSFRIVDGKITGINMIADLDRIGELDIIY